MERVEKESIAIKIILSIIFLIVDTILLFFIIGITKVDAATSTSEIPFTQLATPWEIKYGNDSGGNLTSADMSANYINYNYPGIERYTYYTGTQSSSSKIFIMKPQNPLMANGYYSLSIYYKYNSGTQIWSNTYAPCVGTYGQCGVTRNHNTQLIYSSNPNTTAYLTAPQDCGDCGYPNGSPSASTQWQKITMYEMSWIFKPSQNGEFITLWFDISNTSQMQFYGYTIEAIGNDPVNIVNAISGISTQINNQTTSINNYTQQQNQQTQQAVEESTEQQTQDLYGDDLDENDKAQADNTGVNNYEDSEEELNALMDANAIDGVNFEFDAESKNWIWDTMTSLLNTNTIVYTMVISILAIGVIKLALAR